MNEISKVIGFRIKNKELYEKIKNDPRSNTEIFEQALEEHYNKDVNGVLTPIYRNYSSCRGCEFIEYTKVFIRFLKAWRGK